MSGSEGGPLWPVIVQDAATGRVLMLAWENAESLERCRSTGWMHYYSRSRGALWEKGATSGHRQELLSLDWDCDRDALLARVRPLGPACHEGHRSCFDAQRAPPAERGLTGLWATIAERDRDRPPGSYVARLLEEPVTLRRKLGEESVELLLAPEEGRDRVVSEAADLIFHLSVFLYQQGVTMDEVEAELDRRRRR